MGSLGQEGRYNEGRRGAANTGEGLGAGPKLHRALGSASTWSNPANSPQHPRIPGALRVSAEQDSARGNGSGQWVGQTNLGLNGLKLSSF